MEMTCEACGSVLNLDDRVVAGVPDEHNGQDHSADDPFAGANRPLLWHEEDFPGPDGGYREVGRGTLNELIHGGMIGRYL